MKTLLLSTMILVAGTLVAAGGHRSFRNGLPADKNGKVVAREPSGSAELKAPKTPKPKAKVVTNVVVRCAAVTKAGNQCVRRAMPDGRYCRQHSFIAERDGSMRKTK